jgi:hypothetical protein
MGKTFNFLTDQADLKSKAGAERSAPKSVMYDLLEDEEDRGGQGTQAGGLCH